MLRVGEALAPAVRELLGRDDVVLCDGFLRRYDAATRRALPPHHDSLALCTACVDLSAVAPPPRGGGEGRARRAAAVGGLYAQSG